MTKAYIVQAFTDKGQGGNAAGVVLDAERLSPAQQQRIAAEIGVSETAFVTRTEKNGPYAPDVWRMQYFTPTSQIANCGHATIAALHVLHEKGLLSDGRVTLEIGSFARNAFVEKGRAFLEVKKEKPSEEVRDEFARAAWEALGVNVAKDGAPSPNGGAAVIASAGNPFLLLEFAYPGDLKNLKPDMEKIRTISQAANVVGFYAYTPDYSGKKGAPLAEARMFAPAYGISEEAATGMAAAALTFGHLGLSGQREAFIRQGHLMTEPSPSVIQLRRTGPWYSPGALAVGGSAHIVREAAVPGF